MGGSGGGGVGVEVGGEVRDVGLWWGWCSGSGLGPGLGLSCIRGGLGFGRVGLGVAWGLVGLA